MYSMTTLTLRRTAILTFIRERIADQGQPPSLAEISEAFGFASRSVARKHVLALTEAGFIEVNPHQARGIRLLNQPPRPELLDVPVLGRVAAGLPIGADAEVHSRLMLDPAIFTKAPDYLLRVQGDSMIEDGILDGDLVGVQRTPRLPTARSSWRAWTVKSPSSASSASASGCVCCRATRPISRSSSRPTRTWR